LYSAQLKDEAEIDLRHCKRSFASRSRDGMAAWDQFLHWHEPLHVEHRSDWRRGEALTGLAQSCRRGGVEGTRGKFGPPSDSARGRVLAADSCRMGKAERAHR
jgi:hypothetical protein